MASAGKKPSPLTTYYIMGVYHPKARASDDIADADKGYEIHSEGLKHVSSKIVGTPIVVDHPDELSMSDQSRTKVRGKCIWGTVLNDGRAVFIAELYMDNSLKSAFTRHAIERGDYNGVSLGHGFDRQRNVQTGEERVLCHPDHIAITKTGEEYRPGCRIFSITQGLQSTPARSDRVDIAPVIERISREKSKFVVQFMKNATENAKHVPNMSAEEQNAAQAQAADQGGQQSPPGCQDTQPMSDDHNSDVEQMYEALSQQNPQEVARIAAQAANELRTTQQKYAELQKRLAVASQSEKELLQMQKRAIEEKKKKMIESYAFALSHSIDGDGASDDARTKHFRMAKEHFEAEYPDTDDPDALKHQNESADRWLTFTQGIQVASKDGYERALAARRMSAAERNDARSASALSHNGRRSGSVNTGASPANRFSQTTTTTTLTAGERIPEEQTADQTRLWLEHWGRGHGFDMKSVRGGIKLDRATLMRQAQKVNAEVTRNRTLGNTSAMMGNY